MDEALKGKSKRDGSGQVAVKRGLLIITVTYDTRTKEIHYAGTMTPAQGLRCLNQLLLQQQVEAVVKQKEEELKRKAEKSAAKDNPA